MLFYAKYKKFIPLVSADAEPQDETFISVPLNLTILRLKMEYCNWVYFNKVYIFGVYIYM